MKISLFLSTLSLVLLPMVAAQPSVTVEATFDFGLFDDETPPHSGPTQEQVSLLLSRMSEWFTKQLAETVPSLEFFEANYLCHTFDANAEHPITVEVDGKAFFVDNGQPTPTAWDISTAMASVNYQELITKAVWTADQRGGIFDEVNLAAFASRDPNTPVVCNLNDNANSQSEEIQEEPEPITSTNPSWCGEFPTAVSSRTASNEEDPVRFDPACLEQQNCPTALDAIDGSINCDFDLVTKGYTFNDDYPECTETHYEDTKQLGQLVTVTLPLEAHWHHVVSTLEIEIDSDRHSVHENVSVSWALGATCDGRLGLFYKGPFDEEEEYTVLAVEHVDMLHQEGGNITGSGLIMGGGSAIHRKRRRTHVGCTIGGFHEFWLTGTCYHKPEVTSSDNGSTEDEPTSLDSEDSNASSSPVLGPSGVAWFLSSLVLMLGALA